MGSIDIVGLISLAFGLGMVHALDADHIVAVSSLAGTRVNRRDTMGFCIRWALGHGLSLLLIGSCVFLLGMAIPQELSHYAETMVGAVLITIGLMLCRQLIRQNAHLHVHHHDGLPPHAHWHTHDQHQTDHHRDRHRHRHTAVLVGLVHGTAGSAPLLVLIPLAKIGTPWMGMLYLTTFSIGVMITMLIFGGVLGSVYQWLSRHGPAFIKTAKALIATVSMGYGSYLLAGSLAS
ncbi:MAG: sulfite exporter TauE/SafE family protein [Gammaproteobacteria bacterium]|jgi:ABC-type nickel/cobalt efflux system permease component RcnA